MPARLPGAPAVNPSDTPQAVRYPPTGAFQVDDHVTEDDWDQPTGFNAFSTGFEGASAWDGVTVNSLDVVNTQSKSRNPQVAYDAQTIMFLTRTIQYFGEIGIWKDVYDQDPDDQGEFFKIKDHYQYKRAVLVLDQWAAYKQTGYRDTSLGRQLQADQVQLNLAPGATTTAISAANTTIERRALLTLAGRGGFRRGGGRGGRGGRGGGTTGSSRAPAQVSSA